MRQDSVRADMLALVIGTFSGKIPSYDLLDILDIIRCISHR